MKLNIDMIYDNLSQTLSVQRFGQDTKDLSLRRPAFLNTQVATKPGQLYIVRPNDLPSEPHFDNNSVFICVGGKPAQAYLRGRYLLLLIEEPIDILSVFNTVQEIFNRYDAWDDQCSQCLNAEADIAGLVRASVPLLENPLIVTDSNLCYVARTVVESDGETIKDFSVNTASEPIAADMIKNCSTAHTQDKSKTEPFYYDNERSYCINLVAHNQYAGCLILRATVRPFRPSDFLIMKALAQKMVAALQKYTVILTSKVDTMRSLIRDLLNCYPVTEDRIRQVLHTENPDDSGVQRKSPRFFCFKLKLAKEAYELPTAYICHSIEMLLPGCVSLVHDSIIASVMDLDVFPYSYENFIQMIELFLEEINCQAGISNFFDSISQVHYYHRQACCAIETGHTIDPNRLTYHFSEFVLPYMLSHCTGEFPAKLICPAGLLELRRYDDSSTVDYWATLRTYLDNEMNAAQTAKELFVHRSTFLQRLSRIYSILGMNLDDPAQRLYLRLCISILEQELS